MIAVYGSLVAVLLCTFLPPSLDLFIRNKDGWSWKKALAGYALMTILGGVVPVIVGGTVYISWFLVVLAVATTVWFAPVTFRGSFFNLLVLNIILPLLVLWDMARFNVKEPVKFLLEATGYSDWLRLFVPIILGAITFYVVRRLHQRVTLKE